MLINSGYLLMKITVKTDELDRSQRELIKSGYVIKITVW